MMTPTNSSSFSLRAVNYMQMKPIHLSDSCFDKYNQYFENGFNDIV